MKKDCHVKEKNFVWVEKRFFVEKKMFVGKTLVFVKKTLFLEKLFFEKKIFSKNILKIFMKKKFFLFLAPKSLGA